MNLPDCMNFKTTRFADASKYWPRRFFFLPKNIAKSGALLAIPFLPAWPEGALALQVHDAPGEGLCAHQMAHIYYVIALAFFFVYIRRSDFNDRSWRFLQLFCVLMGAWNLLAFVGHIAALRVPPADLVEYASNLDDRLLPPHTAAKWLYFLARLDNLFSVPALFCLYMALRVFYRQALAEAAAARPAEPGDIPPGEEKGP